MTLPTQVIDEDRRLDSTAATAQEQLARLRWRWTLDETNPDRVSFHEYAAAVGRSRRAIVSMAKGYADWRGGDDVVTPHTLTDQIELAKLGADKRAATEAVAEATGLSVGNVASQHRDRVKDTLAAAQEAAERRGTSVADELPRVAQGHERARQAQAKDRPAKGVLYAKLELRLGSAQRALMDVLTNARDAELDDEMVELLTETLGNLKALIGMIDLAVAGRTDVDWDAEVAKLGGL